MRPWFNVVSGCMCICVYTFIYMKSAHGCLYSEHVWFCPRNALRTMPLLNREIGHILKTRTVQTFLLRTFPDLVTIEMVQKHDDDSLEDMAMIIILALLSRLKHCIQVFQTCPNPRCRSFDTFHQYSRYPVWFMTDFLHRAMMISESAVRLLEGKGRRSYVQFCLFVCFHFFSFFFSKGPRRLLFTLKTIPNIREILCLLMRT